MNIDVFSYQILLESIDYLLSFIQIMATMIKDFMLAKIIYQKGINKNYNIVINGKNFDEQAIA